MAFYEYVEESDTWSRRDPRRQFAEIGFEARGGGEELGRLGLGEPVGVVIEAALVAGAAVFGLVEDEGEGPIGLDSHSQRSS